MDRLQEACREALAQEGLSVDVDALIKACSRVQLVMGAFGPAALGRPELRERLALRYGLQDPVLAVLENQARAPWFTADISDDELEVFRGRFGPEAAARLARLQEDEPHLERFSSEQDADAVLELMDDLVAIAQDTEEEQLELAARQLEIDGAVLRNLVRDHDSEADEIERAFSLRGERVTIGRGRGNDITLPDPQIALHQLTLVRSPNGVWRAVDAGSGRPILVGEASVSSAPLQDGDRLRVGPWDFRLDGDTLRGRPERSTDSLEVCELGRSIAGQTLAEGQTLLEGVSFVAFAGEVVAVVGSSGAGKTSLMHALVAKGPPEAGAVRLGGRDMHALLKQDAGIVALVPQDDIVHAELGVGESLLSSAQLRMPGDADRGVVAAEVDRVLRELGVAQLREQRIGDARRRGISGGQRKRVNLGQELLGRNTRVLLLDEPTTGLDPRSSQDIVRLVRRLADRGRIVLMVTHELSPAITSQVDHLLVLAPGGRPVFFGPPEEACRYFQVDSPDRIFERLEERPVDEWVEGWARAPAHRRTVTLRARLLQRRAAREESAAPRRPPSIPRQLATLAARTARIRLRDRAGLAVLIVQPIVLAAMILTVFPEPTARMIFMVSLSALWFGMSVSVRELISERSIRLREARVGVSLTADLMSKVAVLGLLNAVQTAAFAAGVYLSVGMGDYGFSALSFCAVQALIGFVGVCLGLLISASTSSTAAAVGTLPLLLIPNICFSGIMVSLRDMGPVAKALTWVTPERYAFDLSLKAGRELAEVGYVAGRWERRRIEGALYELGLKPADAEQIGLSPEQLVAVLVTFAAVFLAGAWLLSARRERSSP